ncbi:MAG: hypothetical protein EOO44_04295 [Flavobacterium sp.]|nr:MAG: hypothetical protein EOO44_04295 [Flavobacterium sp.]
MFKKTVFIFFIFITIQAQAQNSKDSIYEDHSISTQLFTKCFENLNQGSDIFENYPALKSMKFCSLIECMFLLSYEEQAIQLAAKNRLLGITTQLYKEGNPVYLINGLDSFLTAQEKNKNLDDDNHLVYITFAECTAPKFLRDGAQIVNDQTRLLINQESSLGTSK